ncbi:hypothetical protein AB0K67_08910 [Nonomuraea sp. NPDC052634]|jgi:hypothetical protein|uniref:hypothetical protein n=1 Tax=Nonomuraea sp. NPDC052634 TaxID=3155813 RepID=UPI0034266800
MPQDQAAMPPTLPPTNPPVLTPDGGSKRPAWMMPTLAAALVVLVAAAGVGAFLLWGPEDGGGGGNPPVARTSGEGTASPSATGVSVDVCSMLPKDEADRLVPGATVEKRSREDDYTINFSCNWLNNRISYGEYWRSREIDVKINQHKGEGTKTGRAMAQNSYEADYRGGKYRETAKPELDPDEKEYISPVKDIPNVGDGAFAQYTWRRSGKLLWYAYGTAYARVGDMTIEVKYQAGQQRKDAAILSNETAQAVTEENAIREVSGLIVHFAKGVAEWQRKHPDVLAQADPTPTATTPSTPAPTATPTPSPTVLASFPAECAAVTDTALKLVPDAETRARGTQVGDDNQTECRWLNRNLPAGEGKIKIRSALITVHRFTNRAGAEDVGAAKDFYATDRGRAKGTAESTIGFITWGKLTDIKGLGDEAFKQYVQHRGGDVAASSGSYVIRKGSMVISVDYSGHQRPEKAEMNAPNVEMMSEKEGFESALTLAKAYLATLSSGG